MRRRITAVTAALVLVVPGCGARLTPAQEAALDGTTSSGQGAVSSGPGAVVSGSGQANQAAQTTPATSGSGTGVPGTVTRTGRAGSNATGTAVASGPNPQGEFSGAAVGTSAPSSLAGMGGRMCPDGASSTDPGVTPTTITVGNIATINGPVPGLFTGARFGTEAVADYINSLGGLCGRQLKVNSADDQFDQATDQQEAQSMSGQVLAFVGSFSLQDGGITSGAPTTPDIGESLSSQRFNSAENFSPQPQAPGYRTGEYQWFRENPQYSGATQHMALMVEDTSANEVLGAQEKAALESVGYKFIFVDTNLQPTDPTFNNDVQKMKAAGVQGVIFQSTGTIIGQLANSIYAAGMTLVLGNYCPSAYDPAYIANAGPGVQGTALSQTMSLFEGEDASLIPMDATFDQWFNRVDPGQTPDLYAAYAWMSGLMLAQAINSGGAPTRPAILAGLKELTSFTGDGMAAPSDPATKSPATCFIIVHVQDGHFVRDAATASGFRCSPSGYYHAT